MEHLKDCIEGPGLSLLSWNIFRNARPERIRTSFEKFLKERDPDIILIQEAPAIHSVLFSDLEIFEPYQVFYAPMFTIRSPLSQDRFTSVGQLTLSKYQILKANVFTLPVIGKIFRPPSQRSLVSRNVLYTRFRSCSGSVIGIYNVHLENRAFPGGRLRQVRFILDIIEDHQDDIVVLGGDFNTFFGPVFEKSIRLFERHGFKNLFTSVDSGVIPRLDYIISRGVRQGTGMQLRGLGSDHEPIFAEIVFE